MVTEPKVMPFGQAQPDIDFLMLRATVLKQLFRA